MLSESQKRGRRAKRPSRSKARALCSILLLHAGACTGDGGLNPGQFNSCAALQNHPLVQQALTALAAGGRGFSFFSGGSPADVARFYAITRAAITFSDDGAVNVPLPDGHARFTALASDDTISWSATQGNDLSAESLRGFIEGTSAGVTLCMFVEVGHGDPLVGTFSCRTQNALFYTLTPGTAAGSWSGTFLNVTLAVLSGSCASPGAFSFGTIAFDPLDPDVPIIEFVRTIPTGAGGITSMVLSSDGLSGFFATGAGAVRRFAVGTGATTPLTLPSPGTFGSIGPLGLSSGPGDVGFVTQGDNRALAYHAGAVPLLEAEVFPPPTPSPGSFLPIAPVFDATGSLGYLGVAYQNHRPAVGVFDARPGASGGGLQATISFTQTDLQSLTASPSGAQLAGVLRGAAPAGRARFVGFVDPAAGALTREVDVGSARFGDFAAAPAAYSADGARLFLTDDTALLSLQTAGLFQLSTLDLGADFADALRHLAVSDDNDLLALTRFASGGRANLVLLDPTSLVELHRAAEPGAAVGSAGGHALFFPGTHVLVVEDGGGRVTPISGDEPFAAGQTRSAFAGAGGGNIVAAAAGGRVLATANATESLIYIYKLTNP